MNKKINIALLDLYNDEPNLGIGNIKNFITEFDGKINNIPIGHSIFNVRGKDEVPSTDYDIYISSGGPGSPFEGTDKPWEKKYFSLLEKIWDHNQKSDNKKHVLFICHSFQLMARFFNLAEVTQRHSRSFGIFSVYKTEAGEYDPILNNLPNPFYAADFRRWQVVQPDKEVIDNLGAKIIALEKIRPHVELERAIMGIRVSNELFGVQFHPEADPLGMKYHYKEEERKRKIINDVGEQKFDALMEELEEPGKVEHTYKTIIPAFLENAIASTKKS